MPIWIIVDKWGTFPLLAFDSEAAARHYIQANDLGEAQPSRLSVYSLSEAKQLWPD